MYVFSFNLPLLTCVFLLFLNDFSCFIAFSIAHDKRQEHLQKKTDQGYQGPKLDKSAMYKCVIFFGYIMISYRFEHNCRQLDTTDLSFIMFANCFLTLKHPPGPQNTNSLLVWGPGSISFHQPRLIQPTELPLRGPCPFSVAIAAATSSGVL